MDVTSALQWFLAVVLLGSGFLKLASQDRFLRTLVSLPWLSLAHARWLVRVVPASEIALAILVLVSPEVGGALIVAIVLVFTGVVAYELRHGRRFDCGCFGGTSDRSVGAATVGRNALIIAIAAAAAATHGPALLGSALTGVGVGLGALLLSVGLDARGSARTR